MAVKKAPKQEFTEINGKLGDIPMSMIFLLTCICFLFVFFVFVLILYAVGLTYHTHTHTHHTHIQSSSKTICTLVYMYIKANTKQVLIYGTIWDIQ